MNSTLNKVLIFAAGASIGSAVAWVFAKKKYERIANEEIAAMKEHYLNKTEEVSDEKSEEEQKEQYREDDAKVVNTYNDILGSEGYFSYDEAQAMRKHIGKDKPYIIEPAEYGEFEDYDLISLTYYADGVLVDDGGEPMENIDEAVGLESLNHIGEFEPDAIHVRNDKRKVDYEILYDYALYSDIKPSSPHVAEEPDDDE